MQLYNTPKKTIEHIQPQTKTQVTVYTCGPTVYDYPHIGNWFTFIRYDILVRTLRLAGLKTNWIMNLTDVGHLVSDADDGEDKLEKGAKREGKTAWEVAAFYGDYFVHGLDRLNILTPNGMPKATDHIAEQINLVQKLEANDLTYIIDDGVYFDTAKFPRYAAFAGLDLDDQQASGRVAVNNQKRNPSDFALWKFSPADEKRDMEWWAPWSSEGKTSDEQHEVARPRITGSSILHDSGDARTESYPKYDEGVLEHEPLQDAEKTGSAGGSAGSQARLSSGSWGFPGWHLECSAMALKYLGKTIDIHAGGIDHIPVHHTNEIAQSEGATNKTFAKYWMHTNHITVEGEKISKSLGNSITLEQIEAKGFNLQAFRLYVLESHYRTQSKFSWDNLAAARNRLQNFQSFADLRFQLTDAGKALPNNYFEIQEKNITNDLTNDLRTPAALSTINEIVDFVGLNQLNRDAEKGLYTFINFIDRALGIDLGSSADITEAQKQIIATRQTAREEKDWAKSDELRDQLVGEGVGVRDTEHGTIWFRL